MQRLAYGENPKHAAIENCKMIKWHHFQKKEIKGLKRCKTKQLRIKFHCTCGMPCNNIEEDKIENVAFKWPHEMCEDVH